MRLEQPRTPPPPSPDLLPRLRFSTDAIPDKDRVGYFRDEIGRMLRLEVEPLDLAPPRYTVESMAAGQVVINAVSGSPTRITRTKAQLADDDDSFLFILHTESIQNVEHNGRAVRLGPGDACLIHSGRVSSAAYRQGGSSLAIRLEGASLRALVKDPEARAGEAIGRARPGLGLLAGYLRSFREVETPLGPSLLYAFGLHVTDLITAVLGGTRDGAAQAETGGVRAARLRQVLDRIIARACDPGFSVETVAAELAVTSRTIQLMLEETGATFSEHVTEQRLRKAWRLLSDRQCGMKIAEITYETGFNDLSHFYRTFRRRFGETPASARTGAKSLH